MSDAPAARARSQPRRRPQLPTEKQRELTAARRLEWTTLVLRLTVVAALYAVVGGSQALAAIWFKSLWALLPPIAFLIAAHIEPWPPTARFPFGFYRVGSIGFLTSALALSAMGAYLVFAALRSLILGDTPQLATFAGPATLLGWSGWPIVAALAYSMAIPLIIGRRRRRRAIDLHDKGLFADASMGRMNLRAGGVAVIGVLGIGFGLPWVDYLASLAIGLDILWHGLRHAHTAVCDLMDEVPRRIGSTALDPIGERIHSHLADLSWVNDVRVRLREEGRLLTGIALIQPDERRARLADFERARAEIEAMDWRLLDFQLVPVASREFARYCPEA